MSGGADPISLAVVLALLALVPLAAVMTTSFRKIAVVQTLVRNPLGVQQVPPNIALYALALMPLAAVMTTSFLKIAVVLTLVRNALGVQQVPRNMALYGLALILSAYVMGPVVMQIGDELRAPPAAVAPGAPAPDRLEGIMDA